MKSWEELIAKSDRKYAFYCNTLNKKYEIGFNKDLRIDTLSTIKLLIMLCLLDKVQRKELSFSQLIKVDHADIGINSGGLLQSFQLHEPFELYNLILLMMSISDNVATNALIRLLSKETINTYCRKIGLKKTVLNMDKIEFPNNYETSKPATGESTPYEIATTLSLLLEGKILNPTLTSQAQRIMLHVQSSSIIRRLPFLMDGGIQWFGAKTGLLLWGQNLLIGECAFLTDTNNQTHIMSIYSSGKIDEKLSYSLDAPSRVEFSELASILYQNLTQ